MTLNTVRMNTAIQQAEDRHAKLFADLLRAINMYSGDMGHQAVEVVSESKVRLTTRYTNWGGDTVITQTMTLDWSVSAPD